MKGEIRTINADDVEIEVKLTLTLKQWKDLKTQLSTNYPSWQISNLIAHLIEKMDKQISEFQEWQD